MSGARSSYLMTLSDDALAEEMTGARAGVREFERWVYGLSPSDRVRDDGKKLAYYRDRLRQLEEESARRKRQRPPSTASASSSSAAATTGSARPKPIGIDDDATGPPILVKDASGNVRTWRPGDGRIHRKRS